MSRVLIDALLVAGIVLSLGLNWALRREVSQPGLEVMPEMVRSPAFKAYSKNPHFSDGKTLQLPVAGTIARGHQPIHLEATPEGAVRAGQELENPLEADPALLEEGRLVYRNFCIPCHGPAGLGDGPVVRRGVPAPASLLDEKARSLPDGQLFHILTFGQGNMASYATQLSREERWLVILYVRSLQQSESGQ